MRRKRKTALQVERETRNDRWLRMLVVLGFKSDVIALLCKVNARTVKRGIREAANRSASTTKTTRSMQDRTHEPLNHRPPSGRPHNA
jgi:hypothetical protein